MAIAIVRQASASTNGAATLTATFAGTPTDGNLLVALYFCKADAGVTEPSTWGIGKTQVNVTNNDTAELAYKVAASSGTGVTITPADAVSGTEIQIYEVSGFTGTPTLDKTNGSGPTTTNAIQPGTTGTLSAADEILFTFSANRATPAAPLIDSGFTKDTTVLAPDGLSAIIPGWDVVSVTTAVNPTISWTTSDFAMAIIASFMGVAGGGGEVPPTPPSIARLYYPEYKYFTI